MSTFNPNPVNNASSAQEAAPNLYVASFAKAIWLPGLAITVLSGLLLTACGKPADAQGGMGGPQGPMPVPVVEVLAKDLPLTFDYPAQVSGFKEVEIRARVSGILEKRQFEEGARVKQGQSLYQLDNAPYVTALTRAQADEVSAQARLSRAERDLNRILPLAESKAVSQAEIDNAKSTVDVAKADLAVAQARVKEARLNLQYARVEAPVSGYASRSLKSEGSLIAGPSELLTTVTQIDKVYVNFGIPEKDHALLKNGVASGQILLNQGNLTVEVIGSDGKPNGMSAKLAFQDVRVNPTTGTVDAKALLSNPKEKLSPGQFVRVKLSGAVQNAAILLPQRAVLESPMGGKIVMTVGPENKVAPRPVQVAQWSSDQWVVTSGLQPGDMVITDGFIKTPPGTPVSPVKADSTVPAQPVKEGSTPAEAAKKGEDKEPAAAASAPTPAKQ